MPTPPGYTVFESTAVLGVGTVLSPFMDSTGFTNMFLECVIANSTGSTTFTIEGSFDGAALDATMPYTPAVTASSGVAGTVFAVQHPFVRFRIVQATASATTSTFFVKSRA
jgi:hypothetical protein